MSAAGNANNRTAEDRRRALRAPDDLDAKAAAVVARTRKAQNLPAVVANPAVLKVISTTVARTIKTAPTVKRAA